MTVKVKLVRDRRGRKGHLTAPQEPQDLEEPSEAAPHLGQLDPCILTRVLSLR